MKKRFTLEQIIRILQECGQAENNWRYTDSTISVSNPVTVGVTSMGAMYVSEVRRLRELQNRMWS